MLLTGDEQIIIVANGKSAMCSCPLQGLGLLQMHYIAPGMLHLSGALSHDLLQ